MCLVDEHGVVLVSFALAVLKPLMQSLAKRFFVLSFVKANAVSLTSPLMKGQGKSLSASSARMVAKDPALAKLIRQTRGTSVLSSVKTRAWQNQTDRWVGLLTSIGVSIKRGVSSFFGSISESDLPVCACQPVRPGTLSRAIG